MSSPGPHLSQLTHPVFQVIQSSEQSNIAHNMKAKQSVGLLFALIAVSSPAFIGDRNDETTLWLKVGVLEDKIGAYGEEIGILEENEKKGKAKIENLERGQDQANVKVVALEEDINILEENEKKGKEKIEKLERGQDKANMKVVALEEEIDSLEENEMKGKEKIETLENELAQYNLKVTNLEDTVGKFEKQLSDTNKKFDNMEKLLQDLISRGIYIIFPTFEIYC
jgi:chromosome segregation ATPase